MIGAWRRRGRIAAIAAMMLAAGSVALPVASVRAFDDTAASFLNPFPEGEIYQISVIGDSFANGVLDGLVDGIGTDTRLNIRRKVIGLSGIMRGDFQDTAADFSGNVAREPINIAVVMTGERDRISIRDARGRRVAVGSPDWVAEYQRRLDRLMKELKNKNVAVYWVGLPNFSRIEANEQAQVMNETIRERAYLNGFKYIDASAGFSDESGGYSAYGPDLEGKIRVLRSPDGMHFTAAGNKKLAHFVEKEIRRDIAQAKQNRDVPLLGGAAEQALVNPENMNKAPAPSSPAADAKGAQAPLIKAQKTVAATPSSSTSASGDQKADNSRITLRLAGANGRDASEQIEIVRPAIPASVVALMARRESSGQPGDLLVDQIDGGVTLMTSISPSGQQMRGKSAPTQAPYFRLLVKGERLVPKPGRADDLEWPPASNDTSDAEGGASTPKG